MNALTYRRRAAPDGGGEGADKAFWISFADMMTALMVLFLMVMAVALLAITQPQPPQPPTPVEEKKPEPQQLASPVKTETPPEPVPPDAQSRAIELLMQQIAAAVEGTPGVQLDTRRHVIDFGDRARFMTGSHRLDASSAQLLRRFVPQLLAITQTTLGQRWIHRVVVEGFADPRGDYLYNLNLSLQRGQRVMCALLDRAEDGSTLTDAQRVEVRDIFSVGGFSFNDQRESLDASRRIELRIEFGPRPPVGASAQAVSFGTCRLAP